MNLPQRVTALSIFCLLAAGSVTRSASAVEVTSLEGLESIFGRYAPGGDCKKQPQILVELAGMTFFVAGQQEKITNPEWAVSYGGEGYDGPARWIFPFRSKEGYPILMSFEPAAGKTGLTIAGHDEGWAGGPKLSARNEALVKGSPYALCP